MTLWDITIHALTFVASVAVAGLMASWAAERRLDRLQDRELARPRLNDQKAADAAEATGLLIVPESGSTLKGGLTDG